jgi:mannose-6-phosphate isomerase-like protein (cupin superfamily)
MSISTTLGGQKGGSRMDVLRVNSSPRYKRNDITSYLLVSEDTCNSKNLTITMVEMEPGGIQHVHSHEPEQMYYVMEGSGLMTVNDEQQRVEAGDCIFFSSLSRHGLENTGGTVLRYLSAASPSFKKEESRKLWPLESVDEEGE